MLALKIINVDGPDDASYYDVQVFINLRRIWAGRVGPHVRSDGWEHLVTMIAREALFGKGSKNIVIPSYSQCPFCHAHVRVVRPGDFKASEITDKQ